MSTRGNRRGAQSLNQGPRFVIGFLKFLAVLVLGLPLFLALLLTLGMSTSNDGADPKRRGDLNNCTNLVQGFQAYHDHYAKLPTTITTEHPLRTEPPIANILLGLDPVENPKKTRFFPPYDAKGNSRAKARGGTWQENGDAWILDWWGNPYYLVFDTNGDKEIPDPFGNPRPLYGRLVIAFSAGKDGQVDLTNVHAKVNKDNVYSWK